MLVEGLPDSGLETWELSAGVMYTRQKEELGDDVAQMVERSLSMREVRGSIPRISIFFNHFES